jgi:hypothetical protein
MVAAAADTQILHTHTRCARGRTSTGLDFAVYISLTHSIHNTRFQYFPSSSSPSLSASFDIFPPFTFLCCLPLHPFHSHRRSSHLPTVVIRSHHHIISLLSSQWFQVVSPPKCKKRRNFFPLCKNGKSERERVEWNFPPPSMIKIARKKDVRYKKPFIAFRFHPPTSSSHPPTSNEAHCTI